MKCEGEERERKEGGRRGGEEDRKTKRGIGSYLIFISRVQLIVVDKLRYFAISRGSNRLKQEIEYPLSPFLYLSFPSPLLLLSTYSLMG
jgi:hypothetical protein